MNPGSSTEPPGPKTCFHGPSKLEEWCIDVTLPAYCDGFGGLTGCLEQSKTSSGASALPSPMVKSSHSPSGALASWGLDAKAGSTVSFRTNGPSGDLLTACTIAELVTHSPKEQLFVTTST